MNEQDVNDEQGIEKEEKYNKMLKTKKKSTREQEKKVGNKEK